MKLNATMFREYDIRGRETPDELNEETMNYIGRGYGTFLKRRGVEEAVVGRDSRSTSAELEKALIAGLISTGCNVIDIGLSTTPMLYWAQYYFKTTGGAAVTASHNPAGWNGVKLAVGYSMTTNSAQLREIYQVIESEDFQKGSGTARDVPVDDLYIEDIVKRLKIERKPKVLLNTG
ncbi:MAG: phosphomannomutase/phosphoglucomutase, partial [Pyrinomonadaceae bacterium]